VHDRPDAGIGQQYLAKIQSNAVMNYLPRADLRRQVI
jgi:hypothetical protein